MIVTLIWKEYREHRAIWFTMVFMTCLLGLGLAQVVTLQGGAANREGFAAVVILGMAIVYGVVCGAMMFAGEREANTMTFLDIFLGRRGLLWGGKVLIGVVFVVLQALAVALVLRLWQQAPPGWLSMLIGSQGTAQDPFPAFGPNRFGPNLWFWVLPVVALEAYSWGLLGSSFTRRVLSGASVAALMATPLWMIALFTPPPAALALRLMASGTALFLSCAIFQMQSRETTQASPPRRTEPHPIQVRLQGWEGEKFDLERRAPHLARTNLPLPEVARSLPEILARKGPGVRKAGRQPQAGSPGQVLWWLTLRQAHILFWVMAGVGLLGGLLLPAQGELLWPFGTLLLGVACGTAAFAQEQNDLAYQFLSAQHLPMRRFWTTKIAFWFITALLVAVLAVGAGVLLLVLKKLVQARPELVDPAVSRFHWGTLQELMGPTLFFGVWLVYGFCAGQFFVLFCRKNVLAVLLAALTSSAVLALWLSALLCGGMAGWQLWIPPLALLAATWFLVRAWAGGRVKERRPLTAGVAIGLGALACLLLEFGYRAWVIADVGEPLDREAFRASLPGRGANRAGRKIQAALAELERPDAPPEAWLAPLAEAARLPVGVIVRPRADGQPPLLDHLDASRAASEQLVGRCRAALAEGKPGPAWEYLVQALALSRNLRNKAPLASYLVGIQIEASALGGLDFWLDQGKPDPDLLGRVLEDLNRHAAQTPAALDCLRTECFRSGGALDFPTTWTFHPSPRAPGTVPEPWLAGAIALSLDTPWENERKTRLWRAAWAGLFRGLQAPPGGIAKPSEGLEDCKEVTRGILRGWLPAPGASLTRTELGRLLDTSWLADERLFSPILPLRRAAARAQWRVASARLKVALGLYHLREGKPARQLADLVPKYLPDLPDDPYTGQGFHYRISRGERLEVAGDEEFQGRKGPEREKVQPGQGILWSTGPDRSDDGGRKHGGELEDGDPRWSGGGFDLVAVVPHGN